MSALDAVRLARAFTGRSLVLALAGGETVRALARDGVDVQLLPDAKPGTLCAAIALAGDRVAAVLVEPSAEENEPLLRRFVRKTRELASAEGAVMIWDERGDGAAAARARLGAKPDLLCGVGWVGGRDAVMAAGAAREVNSYETEYLHEEIFGHEAYLRHGVTLPPGAVVFDVGANIGLFTLFVKSRRPDASVHAFEPAPDAFACLAQNAGALGGVTLHEAAVSSGAGEAELCYYPGYSVLSSLRADPEKDARVIVNSMTHAAGEAARPAIESLVAQRMRERRLVRCRTTTVSEALRESGLARIDLLKVDAERSERAVLAGIAESDWPKIRQLVVEAHDDADAIELRGALERRGFRVAAEREPGLAESGISNLYAIRP